jgi:hypothetical protein
MIWIFLSVPIVILVAASIHLMLTSRPRRPGKILEIWVVHLIFWGIGAFRVITGYEIGTDPGATAWAQLLGWPSGSPFQSEAAGYAIALGVCGLAVAWFRAGWLIAVTAAATIFGWGESILFIVSKVPAWLLTLSVIYNGAGALLLITLLCAYRWRAGALRFWRPSVEIAEEE